MVTKSAGVEAE